MGWWQKLWHSNDKARYIERHCPAKLAVGDKAASVVRAGAAWAGDEVWVIGECLFDSRAVKSWCEAQGIPCVIISVSALVGRKRIGGGHRTLIPLGSKYRIDYETGMGLVKRRLNSYEKAAYNRYLDEDKDIDSDNNCTDDNDDNDAIKKRGQGWK